MKQSEADAIFEKAKEDQVILEPWDQPSGEIRLVDLRAILRSLVVEPVAGVTFSDGEFVPIEDETILQWIAEQLDKDSSLVSEDEPVVDNIHCLECGEFIGVGRLWHLPPEARVWDLKETDKEISLRMYGRWQVESLLSFPDWLKERK